MDKLINGGELVKIHVVESGNRRVYFTDHKAARKYAAVQYDYNEDGVPFMYAVHLHTTQHICDELNKEAES